MRAGLEEIYRDLHAYPELSHSEHRTAGRSSMPSAAPLSGAHQGGTGVVGLLGSGDGPTVLLRADRDALPVHEDSGLHYASTVTTTDADGSEVPVAHACGHDVHVTYLLGAARLLAGATDR
jgi:hippurate hydrolase